MIRLFEFLIHGCFHKWMRVADYPYEIHGGTSNGLLVKGQRFVLQCERCGRMKKFDSAGK